MTKRDEDKSRAPDHDPDSSTPDEVQFENDAELGDIGAARAKLKKLKEEIEKIKKERQEYLDGWQRCKADSVNMRREAEIRATRTAELLREALIHDIIPALDSFDMAFEGEAWTEINDSWRSGMERVRDQLVEALRRHGIERFGKVGDTLDHSLHEVVEERDNVAGEPGTVVRMLRYGYRTRERILRPAQVVIKL